MRSVSQPCVGYGNNFRRVLSTLQLSTIHTEYIHTKIRFIPSKIPILLIHGKGPEKYEKQL